MSRKSAKSKSKPRVTATVTATEAGQAALADVFAPPPKPGKEPVIKTTASELNEALDFASDVGRTMGRIQGAQIGRSMPRTVGELRVQQQKPLLSNILQEVFIETQKALEKHGPMHSPHEGAAVIQEEFEELWDEIKADRGRQKSARVEAIQLAAMAVRYALDLDPR